MMSSAVPTIGRRQRPMTAVMTKSAATSSAMPARMPRLGMVELTSVKPAPMARKPSLGWITVAYWSNQMLTPCSAM